MRIFKILLAAGLCFQLMNADAYVPRNLLQKQAGEKELKSLLAMKSAWISYPAYTNRLGWDNYTKAFKADMIQDGEKYLKYKWQVVTAANYLEYERTGSRVAMENPFGDNNTAFTRLVFAELAEGKGRFIDQIINGVWQYCDMSSWVLSAHLPVQKSKRSLPDENEIIIDLTSGDVASLLSWTWYFLHDEFDKVNPVIAARLKGNITKRILEPYMARDDYWWQAFNYKPGTLVNNWNPWCNFNVLTCFLLLEDDANKQAAGVYRTMQSTDQFINYVKEDGACEEGPSYWGHAAGKLYDYLQLLSNATRGRVSIFKEPMIKNMGEYIARSYIGNNWVVNFADASAKGGGNSGLIYRYGKAVNSNDMKSFAAYLLRENAEDKKNLVAPRDFFRSIENIASYDELSKTDPALPKADVTWYSQTEFCYMKGTQGFFFAAKAGFNNESHNHNDVGTFSLYVDTLPLIIDAGVGTYTKQTFSGDRYSIWTMQSNYHNLPVINGKPQQYGAEFKASGVMFNEAEKTFSMDIAKAYPAETSVKKWLRSYTLKEDQLLIEENFELAKTIAPNQVNFLTWAKPDIASSGKIILEKEGRSITLQYDAAGFNASVDTIPLTDSRLSNVWGPSVYRLSLSAKKMELKGKYLFSITKNKR